MRPNVACVGSNWQEWILYSEILETEDCLSGACHLKESLGSYSVPDVLDCRYYFYLRLGLGRKECYSLQPDGNVRQYLVIILQSAGGLVNSCVFRCWLML